MHRSQVLFLTDGADNSSEHSFEETVAKMAKPGCVAQIIVISVCVDDQTRRRLERMCEPKHAKLVCLDDDRQIKDAFNNFKAILITETERVFTQRTRVVSSQARLTRRSSPAPAAYGRGGK